MLAAQQFQQLQIQSQKQQQQQHHHHQQQLYQLQQQRIQQQELQSGVTELRMPMSSSGQKECVLSPDLEAPSTKD